MYHFFLKRRGNLFFGPDGDTLPGNGNNPPVVPPVVPPTKTYTQDELNAMVAQNRRALQTQLETTTAELSRIRDLSTTSEEQRSALQEQITTLEQQFQTKEQLQQQEYVKLQKKYESDTKKFKEDAGSWQSRFEKQLTNTEIARHAAAADAHDVDQIAALLLPKTKVVEALIDGKPSGEFVPQVTMQVKGEDGKMLTMTLSVEDAVKAMTKMPEKYGNLWKTDARGGVGGNNSPANKPAGTVTLTKDMSMDDYVKNREAILSNAG